MNLKKQTLSDYYKPFFFMYLSKLLIPFFFVASISLLLSGLILALKIAPVDYHQGENYRMIFIHVPCAYAVGNSAVGVEHNFASHGGAVSVAIPSKNHRAYPPCHLINEDASLNRFKENLLHCVGVFLRL